MGQELPKFIQDRIDYCDSQLSDRQASQLRKELNDLENYFLMNGILNDRSGSSFRAVYGQIVRENDLVIDIDVTYELLDSLELPVCNRCFYKVLTPEQLSQLTLKHQEAIERISTGYNGDITPSSIAQRILENLSEDDFELEFFRVSALLSFYKISSPIPNLVLLPRYNQSLNANIKTIHVDLNENSQIVIDNDVFTTESAELEIYEFLLIDPEIRGIEFTSSRVASYESYLKTKAIFDSVYLKLQSEKGDVTKKIIFREPK